MKVIGILVLLTVGIVMMRFSADVLGQFPRGLATGIVFGVLAGLPAAIVILASSAKSNDDETPPRRTPEYEHPQPYVDLIEERMLISAEKMRLLEGGDVVDGEVVK